jgi:mannose-6-phosphate isomerase-like protein (cupin superfamily)
MDEATIRTADTREVQTGERCLIRELVNDPAIAEFSLAETRVKPGIITELHRLTVDEVYVIRRGAGRMEVGGNPWVNIKPGDFVVIPAGISQRIENTGTGDLIFECICLPRFTAGAYESLEKP